MVLLTELVHAVAFLPLLVAGVFLLLVFHLVFPALAEVERRLARLAGSKAPGGRRSSERFWPWLTGRIAHRGFWAQDVPLVLGGVVLSAADFFVALTGGSVGGVLIGQPFLASPANPVWITVPGWHTTARHPEDIWWLVPLGLACLALTAALLLLVGRLRLSLAAVLSGRDDAERLEELTAQVGHLSAGRATLVDAFDAERTRIERDLHDGAQQELVALTMSLGLARVHAAAPPEDRADPAGSAARAALLADLDAAQDRAEAALRALRETVHGIRPAVLTERGLVAAVRDLAGRAPLPTSVVVTGGEHHVDAVTSPVSTAVYFAVAEALTNAAKYAGPTASAHVDLDLTGEGLTAVVTDDGPGGTDPSVPGATGLAGMAQRLESVGASLRIDSSPAGTRLTICSPPPRRGRWRERGNGPRDGIGHSVRAARPAQEARAPAAS